MHPIETAVIDMAQRGAPWSLEDIGGIDALAPAVHDIGASPVMPEILGPFLDSWKTAQAGRRSAYLAILQDLLSAATIDFVLTESTDILDQHRPLPENGDELCFNIFLSKAVADKGELPGQARGAALDGAFRWAVSNRRWQYRLLDALLGVSAADDPSFLKYAAKVIGVAFSHWRENDLVSVLLNLAEQDDVRGEATFELGMATLVVALENAGCDTNTEVLQQAKSWFEASANATEYNPAASLYGECLTLVLAFYAGAPSGELQEIGNRVKQDAFGLNAWVGGRDSPSWLGSRYAESVCWSVLASKVTGLAHHLDEPSWWQPAVVIEEALLTVYSAGRSILRRSHQGAIEELLRPRIQHAVATQAGQLHVLQAWLRQNADSAWASDATALVDEVKAILGHGKPRQNPSEAASETEDALAAAISRSSIPGEQKRFLSIALSDVVTLLFRNLTAAEVQIIEQCCQAVSEHPDYGNNENGRVLFNAAIAWLVRFVYHRMEVTRRDDPGGSYLFERDDGSLPHEDELQEDFFRWLTTNAAGSDLEPTNLGSGRADIRMKSGPERLVIEVKREEKDASFDALATSYAAQTTDYQNVSIRLGVLLVLDLATPNRQGTPHLTSLFSVTKIQRPNENEPRLVLIVKVPGRRRAPSDLTKLAKSTIRDKGKIRAKRSSGERKGVQAGDA
ncbi:hypothetical protein WS63_30330 [Burkholderia stagnalis]|uniref:hypothetical protein n=1 Tax=Burkholderia stagnalis TaxID=1503054 RepID=UPI00075BDACB|nr:hypothetical protein [Burkholderia stagnalis]KVD82711.1 hypothetical protein WS63_30330 [Burkholderia stagnalis]KVO52588.1 hypothetical protein WT17_31080 [Burkholderia stagnalis]KVO77560.1 hypothetical protein WT19_08270 [Burkholderia stagnalis]KVW68897.1 hypothetical protein WT28_03140 [Burkholderia stagnalis]KVX71528.1 hypothetical protein WT34_20970 [Burkholderia stagnalis]